MFPIHQTQFTSSNITVLFHFYYKILISVIHLLYFRTLFLYSIILLSFVFLHQSHNRINPDWLFSSPFIHYWPMSQLQVTHTNQYIFYSWIVYLINFIIISFIYLNLFNLHHQFHQFPCCYYILILILIFNLILNLNV